jgi:hypothetical protein
VAWPADMPIAEAVKVARQVEEQAIRGSGKDRAKVIRDALEALIALAEGK